MTRVWQSSIPENPFSAWLRRQADLDSVRHGLSITDLDYLLEKYVLQYWGKKERRETRKIKACMMLEVKWYNAEPSKAQLENLLIHHIMLYTNMTKDIHLPMLGTCKVRHFGVNFLSLPGEEPQEHGHCRWGRFMPNGVLQWTQIPCVWLPDILNFNIRPDLLTPWELRLHHAKREVECQEEMPLGFTVPTTVIKRS